MPLSARSQIYRLSQLPVPSRTTGQFVPLRELGSFEFAVQDKPIYRKDLRPVEFVTAETVGRLAAPVYGQAQVEDLLKQANDGKGYRSPDGALLQDQAYWLKAPQNVESKSAFEWGGEWTVAETFRDMGIAFGAALILIYMLIVAQFGNFYLTRHYYGVDSTHLNWDCAGTLVNGCRVYRNFYDWLYCLSGDYCA